MTNQSKNPNLDAALAYMREIVRAAADKDVTVIIDGKFPVIAKDARETLLAGLECKHASLKARLASDSSSFFKGHIDIWFKRISRARAWLAQCPETSDKAVCPKCGSDDTSIICHEDVRRAVCRECRFTFPVQVLVISPPREPKGGEE